MRGFALFGGPLAAIGLLSTTASAAIYTGSLTYPGTDLQVSGQQSGWPAGFALSWRVSDEDPSATAQAPWRYEYTVEVAMFAPRRILIEAGSGLDISNLVNVTLTHNGNLQTYAIGNVSVGTHAEAQSNGGLPESLFGILFDSAGSGSGANETITVSFFTSAAPGWGDFYSRCDGNGNRAWNSGFTASDTDPLGPVASGSLSAHILAPVVVPEPGAAIAIAGLAGLIGLRRRR